LIATYILKFDALGRDLYYKSNEGLTKPVADNRTSLEVPVEQNQEFEFVLKPDKKLYISLTDFSRYLKTLNCFNNF